MAEDNYPDRPKIHSLDQLTLTSEPLQSGAMPPKLIFSVRNGYPRISFYRNRDRIERPLSAGMDIVNFNAMLDALLMVVDSKDELHTAIECQTSVWDEANQRASRERRVIGHIKFGITVDRQIYIGMSEDLNEALDVYFYPKLPDYHVVRRRRSLADGWSSPSPEAQSRIAVKAYVAILRHVMNDVYSQHAVPPEGRRRFTSEGSSRRSSPSADAAYDDDVTM